MSVSNVSFNAYLISKIFGHLDFGQPIHAGGQVQDHVTGHDLRQGVHDGHLAKF